tara:strand:- start:148 stop:504 length:357 start_codon:yes stop_codon:yes gene_type:complete
MAFKMKYNKNDFPFKKTFERRTFRDDYGDQMDQKQAYFENQKAKKQAELGRMKKSGKIRHDIMLGETTPEETVENLKKEKRGHQWDKFKSFFGGGKEKRQEIQKDIDLTKENIDKYEE